MIDVCVSVRQASQDEVYAKTVMDIVPTILNGYHATIFAYVAVVGDPLAASRCLLLLSPAGDLLMVKGTIR